VWYAFLKKLSVISFFEELMVTGDTFLAVLENITLHHVRVGTVLQLDHTPPHFSHCVCAFIDKKYPDCWVGRGEPIPWFAHSPVFSPLDFFFWGFVKDIDYHEKVQNVNEVHDRIVRGADDITDKVLAVNSQETEYWRDVHHTTNGAPYCDLLST